MPLSAQIKPISYLKAHASEIISSMAEQDEPMIITQNGEAKAVIQSIDEYDRMQEAIAMLKILAIGDREIENGEYMPMEEAFESLYKELEE